MTQDNMNCPNCDLPADLVREERTVPLGQRRVQIEDEFLRCGECDEEFYTPELADQRHQRAVDRARLADNLLSPSQIKGIRERLGLTQRMFERVLGVGEKTCVRWEMGRVCQNVATDRLIRLIESNRTNVELLASINGVALPEACFVPPTEKAGDSEPLFTWVTWLSTNQHGSVLISGNLESHLGTSQFPTTLAEGRGSRSRKPRAVNFGSQFATSGGH